MKLFLVISCLNDVMAIVFVFVRIVTTICYFAGSLDTMKFQQKHMTSASSKTKVVRENFSAERAGSETRQGEVFQGKGQRSHRIAREEMNALHTAAFKQVRTPFMEVPLIFLTLLENI